MCRIFVETEDEAVCIDTSQQILFQAQSIEGGQHLHVLFWGLMTPTCKSDCSESSPIEFQNSSADRQKLRMQYYHTCAHVIESE